MYHKTPRPRRRARLAALLLAFAYLTFFAPPLPLFQDAATGQYGLG